ncbi:hypothetical protein Pelo_15186 [Pelomyxa schiedti]|nr:hypothetical protein Pelo_15186 [Pelomyxa schiedti]
MNIVSATPEPESEAPPVGLALGVPVVVAVAVPVAVAATGRGAGTRGAPLLLAVQLLELLGEGARPWGRRVTKELAEEVSGDGEVGVEGDEAEGERVAPEGGEVAEEEAEEEVSMKETLEDLCRGSCWDMDCDS